MKKIILTLMLIVIVLSGCKEVSETVQAKQDVDRAVNTAKSVNAAINEQILSDMKSSTTSISTEHNEVIIDPDSEKELLIAIRNNQEADAVFDITVDCSPNQGLISSGSLSVKAGEAEVTILKVDSKDVSTSNNVCKIMAKSDKGDDYLKTIFVSVK
jgi:outer membrane lipoprotein-sorting protein